jgi:hypothetical protein
LPHALVAIVDVPVIAEADGLLRRCQAIGRERLPQVSSFARLQNERLPQRNQLCKLETQK